MAEAEPPTNKYEINMEGNKPTSLTTERRPSRKRTITTLYETDSYVAVDKPYDMRIDKQKNDDGDPNLQDLVRASLPPAVRTELRHCHQLDYATSGVMLYATSKKAAAAAQICFQERRVQKEYLALVWGTPPSRELSCAEPICQSTEDAFKMMIGDVDAVWPLLDQDASKADRDERRRKRKHSGPAPTPVLELARGSYRGEPVAKLLLKPTSGRRHQLRLHCVALGLPIVGDATYGADDGAPRMMLHARTLRLPVGEEGLEVSAPDPFRTGVLEGLSLQAAPAEHKAVC